MGFIEMWEGEGLASDAMYVMYAMYKYNKSFSAFKNEIFPGDVIYV